MAMFKKGKQIWEHMALGSKRKSWSGFRLVAFFLHEAFKEDECAEVVSIELHLTTACRKVVDIAAKIVKIVKTSGKIILEVTRAVRDCLELDELRNSTEQF